LASSAWSSKFSPSERPSPEERPGRVDAELVVHTRHVRYAGGHAHGIGADLSLGTAAAEDDRAVVVRVDLDG
jgi:hypothetical protein